MVSAVWEALRVLLLGIGAGALVAAALAPVTALTRVGRELLRTLTRIARAVPPIVVLPVAMLWLGRGTSAIVVTAANAAVWPLAANLAAGLEAANPTLLAVGRNIGLSRLRLVTDVVVPSALPHAIAGLKAAWASGWHTVVAAELVLGFAGGDAPFGAYIAGAGRDRLFAALLALAALGVVFEAAFGVLERRTVVRWGMPRATAVAV